MRALGRVSGRVDKYRRVLPTTRREGGGGSGGKQGRRRIRRTRGIRTVTTAGPGGRRRVAVTLEPTTALIALSRYAAAEKGREGTVAAVVKGAARAHKHLATEEEES